MRCRQGSAPRRGLPCLMRLLASCWRSVVPRWLGTASPQSWLHHPLASFPVHLSGGGEFWGDVVQPRTARAPSQGPRSCVACPPTQARRQLLAEGVRAWVCGLGSLSLFFTVTVESEGCLEMKILEKGRQTDERGPALPGAPWSQRKPAPGPLSVRLFPFSRPRGSLPRLGGGHRAPFSLGGCLFVFLCISGPRPSAPSGHLSPSSHFHASGAFAPVALSSCPPSLPGLLCCPGPCPLCTWAVCLQVGGHLPADTGGLSAPRLQRSCPQPACQAIPFCGTVKRTKFSTGDPGWGARAEKFPEGSFGASTLAGVREGLGGRPLGVCPELYWGTGWMTSLVPFVLWCSDSGNFHTGLVMVPVPPRPQVAS